MIPLGDGRNFDITVRSDDGRVSIYRTLEVMSTSGSKALHGRGTRVWKAVPLLDGKADGDPVVLKDVWMDHGEQPEGAKIEAIRTAERKTEFDDFVDRLFLTVKQAGNVFVGDNLDRTRDLVTEDRPSTASPFDAKSDDSVHEKRGLRKVHFRIVFAEVCYTIHRERSLSTVFEVLGYAAMGTPAAYSTRLLRLTH